MAGDAKGWQASASPSQVSLYCRSLDTFERSRGREEGMTAWRSSGDDEEMRRTGREYSGVVCNERRFVIPPVVEREQERQGGQSYKPFLGQFGRLLVGSKFQVKFSPGSIICCIIFEDTADATA